MIIEKKQTISKSEINGLEVISVPGPLLTEHYITIQPEGDGTSYEMFEKLAGFLNSSHASIVKQYVFGGCKFHKEGMDVLKKTIGEVKWPVMWIQGDPCSGKHITGTQVYAVSGTDIQNFSIDGRVVGSSYEDTHAEYCFLANLQADNISLSKAQQTRETFLKMETALAEVGMDFSNVVRTWIYLDDLLSWYDEFNAVRTQFFHERGVFGKMVPASTGIGTSNPASGALVTGLMAIKPKNGSVNIQAVASPLQCPALDYKSSFSRAVEISSPNCRKLLVSGTASIEPKGATAHIGDTRKQIALTMEVVEAILKSRQMNWSDTTRGIAYFKNDHEVQFLQEYCDENNIPHIPMALAHSDICRDDLLFELELDAASLR